MDQTTIGNKKIANGVLSKKRSSRRADDAPEAMAEQLRQLAERFERIADSTQVGEPRKDET
ncbi:MAG: hypothetical protein WAM76_07210 [Pseudolabrys sp.]|jgi:hypothetical protein